MLKKEKKYQKHKLYTEVNNYRNEISIGEYRSFYKNYTDIWQGRNRVL